MAPFLFVFLWRHEYGAALALILVAGITDGLDGLAARRWNSASRFGAYLDPVADKVLLSGAFLTLALSGGIEKWLAWLVLGRDVGILLFAGGAFLFSKSLRSFPPSIWGKASTVAQIAFVVALVMQFAGFGTELLALILRWMTVVLTVGSGIDYLVRGMAMVGQQAREVN